MVEELLLHGFVRDEAVAYMPLLFLYAGVFHSCVFRAPSLESLLLPRDT